MAADDDDTKGDPDDAADLGGRSERVALIRGDRVSDEDEGAGDSAPFQLAPNRDVDRLVDRAAPGSAVALPWVEGGERSRQGDDLVSSPGLAGWPSGCRYIAASQLTHQPATHYLSLC